MPIDLESIAEELGQSDIAPLSDGSEADSYPAAAARVGVFKNGRRLFVPPPPPEPKSDSLRHRLEILNALLRLLVVRPFEQGWKPIDIIRFQMIVAFRCGQLPAKNLAELGKLLGLSRQRMSQLAGEMPQEWKWLVAPFRNEKLDTVEGSKSADPIGLECTSDESENEENLPCP